MPERRPENSVLAYEMLELREKLRKWQEELESLGLVGKWVPGLQDISNSIVETLDRFMSLIETTIVDGYGIPFEQVERMMAEIEESADSEEEE